jgi:S-adenosylmethionine uptake transporter
MLLMVAAMLILPGIDAIAKWLSGSVSPAQIAWSRFAVQTLCMLPLLGRFQAPLRPQELVLHALRGLLMACATVLIFTAVAYMPLADVIGIFFIEPLLLTLLARFFLQEDVGWRRLGAVVAGLLSALLVIRPGYSAFGWASALPVGAALCFALYLLLTRRLAVTDDPARMQCLSGVAGLLFMSVVLAVGEVTGAPMLSTVLPSAGECMLLVLLGLIATYGHLLVVHAFKRAPAVLLAPFQFLEIVSATLLGLLLFGDFPDLLTGVGIAGIVGSGWYVFYRERVRGRTV